MSFPNLNNMNTELEKNIDQLRGGNGQITEKLLMDINDSLIILQKELRHAFENLGYENMPTVRTDVDGIKTTLTGQSGDIATLIRDNDLLRQEVEGTIVEMNGKITTLTDLINSNKGEIDGKIDSLTQTVSSVSQRADSIESTVTSKTTEFENGIATLNETTGRLEGDIEQVTTNLSTISQRADSIELSVSQKVDSSDFNGSNIISKINLDSSSATISANKITLDGITEIVSPYGNAKFVFDQNGLSVKIRNEASEYISVFEVGTYLAILGNGDSFWYPRITVGDDPRGFRDVTHLKMNTVDATGSINNRDLTVVSY